MEEKRSVFEKIRNHPLCTVLDVQGKLVFNKIQEDLSITVNIWLLFSRPSDYLQSEMKKKTIFFVILDQPSRGLYEMYNYQNIAKRYYSISPNNNSIADYIKIRLDNGRFEPFNNKYGKYVNFIEPSQPSEMFTRFNNEIAELNDDKRYPKILNFFTKHSTFQKGREYILKQLEVQKGQKVEFPSFKELYDFFAQKKITKKKKSKINRKRKKNEYDSDESTYEEEEGALIREQEARIREQEARIREQENRIRTQEARVKSQESRIQSQESRLASLEALILFKDEKEKSINYQTDQSSIRTGYGNNCYPLSMRSNHLAPLVCKDNTVNKV